MQLYLTHWLKYGLRKLIVCFRAELIALDEIFIIWCSHLGKSHMCGSSCLENTVPTEFIWAQPSQNPTRNYKMWPITMCPLPSIFATLEMHQRGKEAARAQTGNWTRYKQRQYRTAKWTEQSICSFWNILKFTSATLSRPLSRPLSRVHRPEAVKTFLNVTSGNLQCMASTFTHTHTFNLLLPQAKVPTCFKTVTEWLGVWWLSAVKYHNADLNVDNLYSL